MAADKTTDLYMKFVGDNGEIAGETRTEVSLRNLGISKGFRAGFMFEVDSFSFKTGIAGDDGAGANVDPKLQKNLEQAQKLAEQQKKKLEVIIAQLQKQDRSFQVPGSASGMGSRSSSQYKDFRLKGAKSTKLYPVDVKPVEFTRGIDQSSAELLSYCIKKKTFDSASLIKRRPSGGPSSGEVFLRMDFKTVLLTKVDWQNEDPVEETVEFVCRAVCIRYLPTLPSGEIGAAIQRAWSARRGDVTAEKIDR